MTMQKVKAVLIDDRKKDLTLVEFLNATKIPKDGYDTYIYSRQQPARMSSIIRLLRQNEEEINDILVEKEKGIENTRSKKAFIWGIMDRGYTLSRDIELITKLEKYGAFFKITAPI